MDRSPESYQRPPLLPPASLAKWVVLYMGLALVQGGYVLVILGGLFVVAVVLRLSLWVAAPRWGWADRRLRRNVEFWRNQGRRRVQKVEDPPTQVSRMPPIEGEPK